jgi:hypothetical protein
MGVQRQQRTTEEGSKRKEKKKLWQGKREKHHARRRLSLPSPALPAVSIDSILLDTHFQPVFGSHTGELGATHHKKTCQHARHLRFHAKSLQTTQN